MHIKVRAKRVYGQIRYYPDNEAARALAHIARDQTLTPETLRYARQAGATTECVYASELPATDNQLFHILTPIDPVNIRV